MQTPENGVKGRIHSFLSMGAVDGPGLRYVVFLQGCPLRCACCHNPDTWNAAGGTEYTVEDVLRTAFACMFRMKDEMDALALAMEQGASDDATLRRYGELNARFEGLGGWDTDTAVNKVANGLSISDEMRTRLFDRLSGGEKTRVNLGRLILEDTCLYLTSKKTARFPSMIPG